MKVLLFLIGIAVGWWARGIAAHLRTASWVIGDEESNEDRPEPAPTAQVAIANSAVVMTKEDIDRLWPEFNRTRIRKGDENRAYRYYEIEDEFRNYCLHWGLIVPRDWNVSTKLLRGEREEKT
jgi:hypothetical protein